MTKSYQIVPPPGRSPTLDPKRIAELLGKDGQLILPLLDLLESGSNAGPFGCRPPLPVASR
jgi:hypothetical protein